MGSPANAASTAPSSTLAETSPGGSPTTRATTEAQTSVRTSTVSAPASTVSSASNSVAQSSNTDNNFSTSSPESSITSQTRGFTVIVPAASSPVSTSASSTYPSIGIVPTPAESGSDVHKHDDAVKAVGSISAVIIFLAICYCLFRFCPPIRNRYLTWKDDHRKSRAPRMGISETPLPSTCCFYCIFSGILTKQCCSWTGNKAD